jgi:hypothetical protein
MPLTYNDAEKYIHELNQRKFAGNKDWRLPTLAEAMFLLEPRKPKKDGTLYLDPVFDHTQQWIWTQDESHTGVPWVVTFRTGCCYVPIDRFYFVRAVRGEYWVPSIRLFDSDQDIFSL